MARINRSDVIQKAVNDLALSTSNDFIPSDTLDKVQLTYDLKNNFSNFVLNSGLGTTGSITLPTPTIADRQDIYLTSISLSYIKDATCDLATGNIQVSVVPYDSNVATPIIRTAVISLTAQNGNVVLPLAYPLKLRPNSTILVTGNFTVGVMRREITVTGFTTSSY